MTHIPKSHDWWDWCQMKVLLPVEQDHREAWCGLGATERGCHQTRPNPTQEKWSPRSRPTQQANKHATGAIFSGPNLFLTPLSWV